MAVNLILAVGLAGEIGKKGDLIWKIPEDLKRFKRLTTGHTVVMGRKTWESLPKKPLPGRKNVVITSDPDKVFEGAVRAGSPQEAMTATKDDGEVFIIGGEQIYRALLPYADKIYLTVIEASDPKADARFDMDTSEWTIEEESEPSETPEGIRYRYLTYKRKGQE